MSATGLVLYVVFWFAGAGASGWLFYRKGLKDGGWPFYRRGLKDGADKSERIHKHSREFVLDYIEGLQQKLADVERKYFQAQRDLEALKGGE